MRRNTGWSVLPDKTEKMAFIPVTPCVTPIHTQAIPHSLKEDPEQQWGTSLRVSHHVAFPLELSLPITTPFGWVPSPSLACLSLGGLSLRAGTSPILTHMPTDLDPRSGFILNLENWFSCYSSSTWQANPSFRIIHLINNPSCLVLISNSTRLLSLHFSRILLLWLSAYQNSHHSNFCGLLLTETPPSEPLLHSRCHTTTGFQHEDRDAVGRGMTSESKINMSSYPKFSGFHAHRQLFNLSKLNFFMYRWLIIIIWTARCCFEDFGTTSVLASQLPVICNEDSMMFSKLAVYWRQQGYRMGRKPKSSILIPALL